MADSMSLNSMEFVVSNSPTLLPLGGSSKAMLTDGPRTGASKMELATERRPSGINIRANSAHRTPNT
jgi:hypothetical protein